jgi:hypothetical protein
MLLHGIKQSPIPRPDIVAVVEAAVLPEGRSNHLLIRELFSILGEARAGGVTTHAVRVGGADVVALSLVHVRQLHVAHAVAGSCDGGGVVDGHVGLIDVQPRDDGRRGNESAEDAVHHEWVVPPAALLRVQRRESVHGGVAERVPAPRVQDRVAAPPVQEAGLVVVVVVVDGAGGAGQPRAVGPEPEQGFGRGCQGGEHYQSGERRREEGNGQQRQCTEHGRSGDAVRRQDGVLDGDFAHVDDHADAGTGTRGWSHRRRFGGVLARDGRDVEAAWRVVVWWRRGRHAVMMRGARPFRTHQRGVVGQDGGVKLGGGDGGVVGAAVDDGVVRGGGEEVE